MFEKLEELAKNNKKISDFHIRTGWPLAYRQTGEIHKIPDVFETKTDHLIGYARTEYHCKNCNAHHGHIFDDGPQPTGKRYCNNGVCLVFHEKNKK